MNKKLTLNIDEDLINFAHEYAKKTGQSLSHVITYYLIALRNQSDTEDLSSKTDELYGIFSDLKPLEKKEIRKQFHEKNTY